MPTGWHHNVTGSDSLVALYTRLGDMPQPFQVSVKAGEETRRARQNRFSHEVYKQVAAILGDHTVDDVRAMSKLIVGVPILRSEDDNFREKYDQHVKGLPYKTKLSLMLEPFEFPVTRLMSVRQMADYITRLLQFWDERGASVMLPEYDI